MNSIDYIVYPYGGEIPLIQWFALVIPLIIIVIFSINIINDYIQTKSFDQNKGAGILICGLLILMIGFLTEDELQYKDLYYAVNNEYIAIFDLSESKEISEETVLRYAKIDDLTPHFHYREGVKKTRGGSNRPTVYLNLKFEDGTHFSEVRGPNLEIIAARYHYIHQKNPELLERIVINEAGTSAFDDFLYYLNTYIN